MISLDLLRIALRWVHLVSAVIWIGGTFFFLLAIRPSLVSDEAAAGWRQISAGVERRFHEIVQVCIWTFFISGAILTYDRLTTINPGLDYIATLAIKVLLVLWMVYISGGLRRSGSRRPIGAPPRSEAAAQVSEVAAEDSENAAEDSENATQVSENAAEDSEAVAQEGEFAAGGSKTAARSLLQPLRSPIVQIAIAGSVVLLLADVLKVIAENALRAP